MANNQRATNPAIKRLTKGDGKTVLFGKVASCKFDKEWLNPISNKIIYYHDVITDTGHICNIGSMEKNSIRIRKGAMLEYCIDEKCKTKLISSSNDAKKISEAAVKNKEEKVEKLMNENSDRQRIKGQEAFLGYSWSYAKDLIIAGKTMKNVEELNKVARYIYEEIGKMLNQE
jgi:hypothetical protein